MSERIALSGRKTYHTAPVKMTGVISDAKQNRTHIPWRNAERSTISAIRSTPPVECMPEQTYVREVDCTATIVDKCIVV